MTKVVTNATLGQFPLLHHSQCFLSFAFIFLTTPCFQLITVCMHFVVFVFTSTVWYYGLLSLLQLCPCGSFLGRLTYPITSFLFLHCFEVVVHPWTKSSKANYHRDTQEENLREGCGISFFLTQCLHCCKLLRAKGSQNQSELTEIW